MRFCLVNLDSTPDPDCEEAMVIVPGGEPLALAVPLLALSSFLPLLHEATAGLGEIECEGCGERLPGPRPQSGTRRFEM